MERKGEPSAPSIPVSRVESHWMTVPSSSRDFVFLLDCSPAYLHINCPQGLWLIIIDDIVIDIARCCCCCSRRPRQASGKEHGQEIKLIIIREINPFLVTNIEFIIRVRIWMNVLHVPSSDAPALTAEHARAATLLAAFNPAV